MKIFGEIGALYNYLNGKNEFFFNTENFQRRFMHDFPKLLWPTEKIEDMGDLVLLFPNPAKVSGSVINFDEAEDQFSSMFDTSYSYPHKKKFLTVLRQAFEMAFMELPMKPEEKVNIEVNVDDISKLLEAPVEIGPDGKVKPVAPSEPKPALLKANSSGKHLITSGKVRFESKSPFC